jgi:hypothetical protein
MSNYSCLTLDELISVAETDPDARQYFADNARRFKDEIDGALDDCEPDGSYDDGYDEGRSDFGRELNDQFCESLATEIAKPGIDADLSELLVGIQECIGE